MQNLPWKFIIVHHSATKDGKFLNDYAAIEKYHMSYRYKDEIITLEKAKELMSKGEYVIKPWRKIAYHRIYEYDKGSLVMKQGRGFDEKGAHCVGMNDVGIGVCIVGNFDSTPPSLDVYDFVAKDVASLCKQFKIPLQNTKPHNLYARYKTCPGARFDMAYFVLQVQKYLI